MLMIGDTRHRCTWQHLPILALKGNVMRLLLSRGANVDAKNDRGWTPFRIGSSRGLAEIAELLSDV